MGKTRETSSSVVATFMRPKGDGKARVNIKGGKITMRATENSSKQQGDTRVETIFVDGDADVNAENAVVDMDTRKGGEDKEKIQLTAYLTKVLDTASLEVVRNLVDELQDVFGVYAAKDLIELEVEELEKTLESLKGVQKKKFLRHVRSRQSEERD